MLAHLMVLLRCTKIALDQSGAGSMLTSLGITIPTSLEEAKTLATDLITNNGLEEYTKLTGLTAPPQTESEFAAM